MVQVLIRPNKFRILRTSYKVNLPTRKAGTKDTEEGRREHDVTDGTKSNDECFRR
jgi:hypothetical protein